MGLSFFKGPFLGLLNSFKKAPKKGPLKKESLICSLVQSGAMQYQGKDKQQRLLLAMLCLGLPGNGNLAMILLMSRAKHASLEPLLEPSL